MGVKKVTEDILEWIKNLFRTGYTCASPLRDCIPKDGDLTDLCQRGVFPEESLEKVKKEFDYNVNEKHQSEWEAFHNSFEKQGKAYVMLYDLRNLEDKILNKVTEEIAYIYPNSKQNEAFDNLKKEALNEITDITMNYITNIKNDPNIDAFLVDKIGNYIDGINKTIENVEHSKTDYNYANDLIEKLDDKIEGIVSILDSRISEYNENCESGFLYNKEAEGNSLMNLLLSEKNSLESSIDDIIKDDFPNIESGIAKHRVEKMFEIVQKEIETKYDALCTSFEKTNNPHLTELKSAEHINHNHLLYYAGRISANFEAPIKYNYGTEQAMECYDRAKDIFNRLREDTIENNVNNKYNNSDYGKTRSWNEMADLFVKMCGKLHPEFEMPEEIKTGLDKYFARGDYKNISRYTMKEPNENLDYLIRSLQATTINPDFEAIFEDLKEKVLVRDKIQNKGQQEPIKEDKEPKKEQSYAERHMDSVDIYVDKTAHDYAYQDLGDFGKLRVVKDMQDYMQKADKVKEQLKDVSDKETFVSRPEVRNLWRQFGEMKNDVVLQLAIAEASMTFMHDETEKQQMEFAIRKIEDMLVDCMIDGRNNLYKDFIDKGEINEFGLDKQAQFLNQIHKEVENEMDFITRDD